MENSVRFNQYEILEALSEGKAVSAYRARDLVEGREVVFKEFRSLPGTQGSMLSDLEAIARRALGLVHPNLVPLKKWIDGEQEAYVVRDFLPGKTLRSLLREHPQGLDPATACDILLPVCEALDFVHELMGQAHNGLHPDNILLLKGGRVAVTDFGSSEVALSGGGGSDPEAEEHAYIAPERLTGKGASDPRADVYALGVLLHEMLTGRMPSTPGPAPAWFEETGIARLLAASVKNNPHERYASARGFLEDLKAVRLPPQMSVFIEDTSTPIPRGESHHVRLKIANHGQARLRVARIAATQEWVRKIAPARLDLAEGESQEVALILDTTRLPAGKNECRITIASNAYGSERASFPLAIDILAPSVKAVPPSLNFGKQSGKSQPQQIMASRSDGKALKARVEISEEARSWIRCSKVLDTGNAQMFNVTVDASGLPDGIHRGTITLRDADPFEVKSVQIPVVVLVEAPVRASPPATIAPAPAPKREPVITAPAPPVALSPQAVSPVVDDSSPVAPSKEALPQPQAVQEEPVVPKAGARPLIAGGAPRGGVIARLFARAIDTLLLVAVSFGAAASLRLPFVPDPTGFLSLPVRLFHWARQPGGGAGLPEIYVHAFKDMIASPAWWVGLGISGLYYTLATARWGKTMGKSLMKLEVVHRDGGKLSFRQSLLRWIGYHISELTLGLGYLPALLRTRRGLHDRIAQSYVAGEGKGQKALPTPSADVDLGSMSLKREDFGHYSDVAKDILQRRNRNG